MALHVIDNSAGRARILVTRPPHQQFQHYWSEVDSLLGKTIVHAATVGFVGFREDDSSFLKPQETSGQDVSCDSLTRLLELLECAVAANHEIANDQQRPAISEPLERDADRTSGTGLQFRLASHGGKP